MERHANDEQSHEAHDLQVPVRLDQGRPASPKSDVMGAPERNQDSQREASESRNGYRRSDGDEIEPRRFLWPVLGDGYRRNPLPAGGELVQLAEERCRVGLVNSSKEGDWFNRTIRPAAPGDAVPLENSVDPRIATYGLANSGLRADERSGWLWWRH
jgi:hypothetical protein